MNCHYICTLHIFWPRAQNNYHNYHFLGNLDKVRRFVRIWSNNLYPRLEQNWCNSDNSYFDFNTSRYCKVHVSLRLVCGMYTCCTHALCYIKRLCFNLRNRWNFNGDYLIILRSFIYPWPCRKLLVYAYKCIGAERS